MLWILLFFASKSTAQFADGSGTEEDPFQVETLEQLQTIGDPDHLDKHFIQIADIDAAETAEWNEGKGFKPIGSFMWAIPLDQNESVEIKTKEIGTELLDEFIPFSGSYNGNGFDISDLMIDLSEGDFVEVGIGMFGAAEEGARFTNINLVNVLILGQKVVGGLLGHGYKSLIEYSRVSGDIFGTVYVGGLVGYNTGGQVFSSSTSCSVSGDDYVGGLIGVSDRSGQIRSSYTSGDVSGRNMIGGLTGGMYPGEMHRSYATGDVSGTDYIGGLIGENIRAEIQESYSTSQVTGRNQVGGLIGTNGSAPSKNNAGYIHDSYVSGQVSGNNNVGGMIGVNWDNGVITSSHSSSSVTGTENTGGFAGLNEGMAEKSYWDIETSAQSNGAGEGNSDGLKGLTTSQMTGQDAYIHKYKLDFDQVWQLTEGYPVLAWQQPEDTVDQPEVPIITVSPDTEEYDFGEVETDSSSSGEFTLENTGNSTMNGEVSLSGTNNDGFVIVQGEGDFTLEPGSSRIIEVVFRPAEQVSYQAVLEFHHDAPNEEDPVEVMLNGTGKISSSSIPEKELPDQHALHQNHPNPFNPVTVIQYELPVDSEVRLEIYDLLGRRVAVLVNDHKQAGVHQVSWDATNVASGTYIYRLQAGDFVQSRSMMLVK